MEYPTADQENQLHVIFDPVAQHIRGIAGTYLTDILKIEEGYQIRKKSKFPNGHSIPKEVVPLLTHTMVGIIAELIQEYIDAGSEREVTFENEELYKAIYTEFQGWIPEVHDPNDEGLGSPTPRLTEEILESRRKS